ncbi:MAG: hypothetical protein JXR26_01760 [Balneolaceae bacterium]|nr:hypothetical protein [Balneolaceae bacterium]
MYSIIGLCIAGGLLAIGILAMVVSGLRGMINGKQDFKKIGMFLLPFLVYAIAYVLTQDYSEAGVATMLFMMATMALGIMLTGARTTFNL